MTDMTLTDIHTEIEQASERRAELWHILSQGYDQAAAAELKRLSERLEELWETTGGFGTLLMIAHDWDDKAKWLRSMDLLTHQVVPSLPSL